MVLNSNSVCQLLLGCSVKSVKLSFPSSGKRVVRAENEIFTSWKQIRLKRGLENWFELNWAINRKRHYILAFVFFLHRWPLLVLNFSECYFIEIPLKVLPQPHQIHLLPFKKHINQLKRKKKLRNSSPSLITTIQLMLARTLTVSESTNTWNWNIGIPLL